MKKKILLVIPHLKLGGGAERVAAEVGTQLNKRGYDITFLTIYDEKNRYEFEGDLICLNKKYKSGFPKKFFKGISISRSIAKTCNQRKIDTVISFLSNANFSTIRSKVFFGNKSKVIISARNNPLKFSEKNQNNIKKLYPRADYVVALSEGVKQILTSKFGLNNVKVIHNIQNLDYFDELANKKIKKKYEGIFDEGFVYITVGRLRHQKGQWHLIRSFKSLSEKHKDAKLIVIGDGRLRKPLYKLIKKMNLEDKVFLIGNVNNVFPYLKKGDCFVFSSLYEGFGNVITEALSQNIPVISTDCPSGPREILCPEKKIDEKIDYPYMGKYGILIKNFDHEMDFKTIEEKPLSKEEKMLTEMMMKIKDDAILRQKYSKGLDRSKDFDVDKIIQKWEKLL